MLQATRSKTPQGEVLTLGDGERSVAALLPTAPEFSGLNTSLATLAAAVTHNVATFQPAAAEAANRRDAVAVLPAWREALEACRNRAQEVATADAKAREIVPSTDMSRAPEIRAMWRAMPMAEQVARAQVAPLAELAAVVEAPELVGLSEHAAPIIDDRFMILNHIARTGMAANHAIRPTLGNLLGTGPDMTSAEAAASKALTEHRARQAEVEELGAALEHALAVIALAGAMSVDDAFSTAMAA